MTPAQQQQQQQQDEQEEVRKRVEERASWWASHDPNPHTRQHVQHLLHQLHQNNKNENTHDKQQQEQEAESLLQKYFGQEGRIGFGTAGLRGPMMPGPHGMNDLTVIQATQGLARYCLQAHYNDKDNKDEDSSSSRARPSAVVGYDHRQNPTLKLSSRQFALYAKLVLEEAGVDCTLLDGYVPTPLVSYAVTSSYRDRDKDKHQDSTEPAAVLKDCIVGIMITASHNPKQDCGYKVYWKDGCQIRPPVDQGIAASIASEQNITPWKDYGQILQTRKEQPQQDKPQEHFKQESDIQGGYKEASITYGLSNKPKTDQLANAYYQAMKNSGLPSLSSTPPPPNTNPPLKIVYTALHGVGSPWIQRSFTTFGLTPPLSVPSQDLPHPFFPTLHPTPNPEEENALQQAMIYAQSQNATLILANDPDADRLAVAEYNPSTQQWRRFSGDEVGSMLAHWIYQRQCYLHKTTNNNNNNNRPLAMVASTVSSQMVRAMAEAEGFWFEDTLTGFKWMASRQDELRHGVHKRGEDDKQEKEKGEAVVVVKYACPFSYEEAMGYCCGEFVHDKDGVTAAAVMAELATYYHQQETTVSQHMEQLYQTYGVFVRSNGYYILSSPAVSQEIFTHMRCEGAYHWTVGSYAVTSIRDLGVGYDSTTPDKRATLPVSAKSPMMTIRFENGCTAHFRASGTEPKFKYYLEMRGKVGEGREEVEERLRRMKKVVLEELLKPTEFGLKEG